jgi:hypothetical protein
MRTRSGIALACTLLLAFAAGCGGDDRGGGPPAGFQVKSSLVAKGDSAGDPGELESYEPEGELVADSGFRPEVDGFAFENYTNDQEPRNLGPAEVESLFGEVVCLSGTGEECELIPPAKTWMENMNEAMAGGHCQGFSVAALRMWAEQLDQEDFGAEMTSALDIMGNEPLQASIAEHFVYQALPAVVESRVRGKPSEVLQKLADALENEDELYTLGVYMPDMTGGHAITPFAIEDKGDGHYAILVYDNNFPGITRAVEVDTNTETWSYVSGTNPEDTSQVYEGDAETGTIELDPTLPGNDLQPCPFCGGDGDGEAGKGSLMPRDERYTEITLTGDPRNHPHLVFTDDDGRRTGIVDGEMLREIPDVEVVKTYAVRNWETAPEPRFRLPEGKDYTITVDGAKLSKPTKAKINLVGNGLTIEIEDIAIAPGQQDEMALPGGYGITYQANGDEEVAPNLFAGLVEDDAAYMFAATAVGVKKGSVVSLLVDQDEKVVILDSTGSEGTVDGEGLFILNLTKADADGNVAQWQADEVMLDGSEEEKAGFEYDESPTEGEALPILLLDGELDEKGTIEAAPQEVDP